MTRLRVINEVTDEVIADMPSDLREVAQQLADIMIRDTGQLHIVIEVRGDDEPT